MNKHRIVPIKELLKSLQKECLLPRLKIQKNSEPVIITKVHAYNILSESPTPKFKNEKIKPHLSKMRYLKQKLKKVDNGEFRSFTNKNCNSLKQTHCLEGKTEDFTEKSQNRKIPIKILDKEFTCILKKKEEIPLKINKNINYALHNRSKSLDKLKKETLRNFNLNSINAEIHGKSCAKIISNSNELINHKKVETDKELCKNIMQALSFLPTLSKTYNSREKNPEKIIINKSIIPQLISIMSKNTDNLTNEKSENNSEKYRRNLKEICNNMLGKSKSFIRKTINKSP